METIVALATPPGRSALAVIRLTGPESLAVARTLTADPAFAPAPGRVNLRRIIDQSRVVDQVLITYFQAPNSITGEDMIEISSHGSPVVVRHLIDKILTLNVKPAGPGEFSLRGLINGKMNLSQAEAIRDLINAQTSSAADQAVRQLNGELSLRLRPIKDRLLNVIVVFESALEFVEDDLPPVRLKQMAEELERVLDELRSLAATFNSGHLVRDGIKVAIVGRPNAGKSSLFNRLLGADRAIVTELPGTTRDALTEPLTVEGIAVFLTDTAGMRTATDKIEVIGMERTHRVMGDADLLLLIVDGSIDVSHEDHEVLSQVKGRRHLVALNKRDLPSFKKSSLFETAVCVSATSGEGLSELRSAIIDAFGSVDIAQSGLLITDSRHYDLLKRAETELQSALGLLHEEAGEELILVGLHNGLKYLGEITGETTSEEVLAQIFATFCIGK